MSVLLKRPQLPHEWESRFVHQSVLPKLRQRHGQT
ncbi:Uncharacterised protein [Vibrio cholerae]|nr:Uncharacterised protein [Vibrio cholerae]